MRNGPLQISVLLLVALAGCRGESDVAGNASGGTAPARSGGGKDVQTATLTGLYEGGDGTRSNQLCMIEREEQATEFGFVTWGSGDTNCSGSGTAVRQGDRLQLRLAGDENCTLQARIEGGRITMPGSIPDACQNYYCGPGAQLTDVSFDKVGGDEEAAKRATDLVGDPLCGE